MLISSYECLYVCDFQTEDTIFYLNQHDVVKYNQSIQTTKKSGAMSHGMWLQNINYTFSGGENI